MKRGRPIQLPRDRLREEIYRVQLQQVMDDGMLTMLYLSCDSLLPELYEVLGAEALSRLIEIFGGTTVRFPTRRSLLEAVRDVGIYRALYPYRKNKHSGEAMQVVEALEGEHGLPPVALWKTYRRVDEALGRGRSRMKVSDDGGLW